MSKGVCVVPEASFLSLTYPPVKPTATDLAKEAQAAKIAAAAPFGKGPKGQIIARGQYQVAMQKVQRDAGGLDFKWPFWVGLGAGALGFVVLLARRA